MSRPKFRVRLLQFVAKKLRKWASSIERNVAREQAVVQDPELLLPRGDGPPQHWIDLVREKAPELLSAPITKPPSAHPIREVTSAKSEEFVIRERRTEKPEVEESQPKPLPLKYARRPETLRSRAIARLTRSRFSLRPTSREPLEMKKSAVANREFEQLPVKKARAGESTTEAQRHREEGPRRRSSDRYGPTVEPHKRSSSAGAGAPKDLVFGSAKGELRSDADFDFVEPKRNRLVAREPAPIISEHVKRKPEAEQPAIVKSSRPPHGSTLEPRPGRVLSFAFEPSEEIPTYARERVPSHTFGGNLHEELTTRARMTIAPAPSQIDDAKHTFPPAAAEANHKVEKSLRNVATIIDYSSAQTAPRRFSQAELEKADANIPALLDEDTMSAAAAAQWTKTVEHENPWPDLPSPPPMEVDEQLAAHRRELDRYRRLELEQRGTLWNE